MGGSGRMDPGRQARRDEQDKQLHRLSWRPPGPKKIHWYLPGDLQRNFPARFHPPRGSRGGLWPPFREPPGVILPLLLATSVETTKISQKSGHVYLFVSNLWGAFLCYVWYSLAYLAARPAASQTWKHLKNPLVFTGPKPYAPFSRNTRSDHISEDRRSKTRPIINAPKRPQETRHNEQKNTIFDA